MKKIYQRTVKYILSLLLMFYAFTAGMLTRRGRNIHSLICGYFGFGFDRPRLPRIGWEQVGAARAVTLSDLPVKSGHMPVHELAVICAIVRREAPQAIFEIGTFDGRTTLNLALNAPDDCRIYTLDLPREGLEDTRYPISARYRPLVDKEASGALFRDKDAAAFPQKRNITQLLGDSGKFDFSPYYNHIDLVFIDGSHDYDYVLNDSEIALKLLRNGEGVIIWHDYRSGITVVPALEVFRKRHPQLEIFHIEDTSFAYARGG